MVVAVKVTTPIIRLLHIVDSDEKPYLGYIYIYEVTLRITSAVVETFWFKERLYKPYVNIIDMRWDKHFQTHIHVVAYLLSPTFTYESGF